MISPPDVLAVFSSSRFHVDVVDRRNIIADYPGALEWLFELVAVYHGFEAASAVRDGYGIGGSAAAIALSWFALAAMACG
jgi:hypothetical protein